MITHVAALTRHHLRLGFLVHEQPLSARTIYRYLATCEPVEVDVTVLSVADRLATLGRNSDRAVALHLDLRRRSSPTRSPGIGSARARRSPATSSRMRSGSIPDRSSDACSQS